MLIYLYRCKILKCYEKIDIETRQIILQNFNDMDTKNDQDSYSAGLITLKHISRRRSRGTPEEGQKPHAASYLFKLTNQGHEIMVCKTAFINLHGITSARLRRIQISLVMTGASPKDLRGRHKNLPTEYPTELLNLIEMHINSFQPRQSHYTRRKNPERMYLSESLTIKDMHRMFVAEYCLNIPYNVYLHIFRTKFNIKFGYPRSDTCAECDSLLHKLNAKDITDEEKGRLLMQKELHLRKSEAIKKNYKAKAQAGEVLCFTFDFMQNLPLSHIPTNPVFFSRQLWYYIFEIHDLATNEAAMYTYHEGQAKKGANEVTSMLLHYLNNRALPSRNLVLFRDGCPGQNKNYVMIEKKERKVRKVEIPHEWDKLILNARANPSPFDLVKVDTSRIYDIKAATDPFFLKTAKPPIKIKDVRIIKIEKKSPLIYLRDSYHGPWRSSIVRNKLGMPMGLDLKVVYDKPNEIAPVKIQNLQTLMGFLEYPENKQFYEKIFSQNSSCTYGSGEPEVENEDNSSGCE
jgi:hypothetical protein